MPARTVTGNALTSMYRSFKSTLGKVQVRYFSHATFNKSIVTVKTPSGKTTIDQQTMYDPAEFPSVDANGLPPFDANSAMLKKTRGQFVAEDLTFYLQSGYGSPAGERSRPYMSGNYHYQSSPSHAEVHAAMIMRDLKINNGTIKINNPNICRTCYTEIENVLPTGATLNVELPNGNIIPFTGN